MTLTSVNIKPALLFSRLEQAQALARSIMLTIDEGLSAAIACEEALFRWLRVLEEKKLNTHRWAFLFQTLTLFPLEIRLGRRSCSPEIYKSLVSLFCCYSLYWAHLLVQRAVKHLIPCVSSLIVIRLILMYGFGLTHHFLLLLSCRAHHSRNHANAGRACCWLRLFFFSNAPLFLPLDFMPAS